MKRFFLGVALVPMLLATADGSISVAARGRTQPLIRLAPDSKARAVAIFLPGDGGWRGAAISMSRAIASWGYEVYGFDTKKYLETFTQNGAELKREEMADDMRSLAAKVGAATGKPVILVGWSQGAGMAVAAASGNSDRTLIRGVVTLGLPHSAVLGWDWRATLATIARREPDQPKFAIKPLLETASPVPLWMIHGSNDEYTSPGIAQELYRAAARPKKLQEIQGANHRFDGHLDELYRSLSEGMEWLVTQ